MKTKKKTLTVVLIVVLVLLLALGAALIVLKNVRWTKMTERVLAKFEAVCPVTERDVGEYATVKGNGMTFNIRSYEAEGYGYLSIIEMKAMMGLMTMDTFIFTPVERDAPLFSYDRVLAMGIDTVMLELYDLRIDKSEPELSAFEAVQAALADYQDKEVSVRWYDYLKLPVTFSKTGRNADDDFVKAIDDYADAYIEMLLASPECGREEKLEQIRFYVDGLFEQGSPTVEQFTKLLPQEEAYDLYRRFVFSSEPD